jgi:alpha-L-fucosidase
MITKKDAPEVVAEQHHMIQAANGVDYVIIPPDFKPNTHPDAQWFKTAGLGIFLHWGLSSVEGACDISWGMMNGVDGPRKLGITPTRYYDQAKNFNPQNYHPEKWLAKAAEAGATYAVLTTKHHDGFALWPSKYGDLNTKNYMDGRDLVRTFVEACRKVGLKVGLYFSPPDWYYCRDYMGFNYPGQPNVDMDHQPTEIPTAPEGFGKQLVNYTRHQIEELLTNYGTIDILFFDGCVNKEFGNCHIAIPMNRLRELQPGMVVNPRMHGYGDYITPEAEMPEEKPSQLWELCDISDMNAWGYLKDDLRTYFPTSKMIGRLHHCRAWGGNYLINIAPGPDGDLPVEGYRLLDELKGWIDSCGAAIKGALPGGYPDTCNVPETIDDNKHYLYVAPENRSDLVLKTSKCPTRVTLLRSGQNLPFEFDGKQVTIKVASELRSSLGDIAAVL